MFCRLVANLREGEKKRRTESYSPRGDVMVSLRIIFPPEVVSDSVELLLMKMKFVIKHKVHMMHFLFHSVEMPVG